MSNDYFIHSKEDTEIFKIMNEDKIIYKSESEIGQKMLDFIYDDYKNYESVRDGLSYSETQFRKLRGTEQHTDIIDSLKTLANMLFDTHDYYRILGDELIVLINKKENADKENNSFSISKAELTNLSRTNTYMINLKYAITALIEECLDVDSEDKRTTEEKYSDFMLKEKKKNSIINLTELFDNFISTKMAAEYNSKEKTLFEIAKIESVYDYFTYFVHMCFRKQLKFRKCKFCDKYFPMITNMNTEYCNRKIIGSDSTCREAGSARIYNKKQNQNPIVQIYNREYKKIFARIKYGMISKTQFNYWSEEARKMRDKALVGEISQLDFEVWLAEQNEFYK